VGNNWIQRENGIQEVLDSTATVEIQPGDIFVIETPGGGGFQEQ
jgi:N-methylhydantoinase B